MGTKHRSKFYNLSPAMASSPYECNIFKQYTSYNGVHERQKQTESEISGLMLIILDAYFKIAVLSSYVRFEGIVKLFKIKKPFNLSY